MKINHKKYHCVRLCGSNTSIKSISFCQHEVLWLAWIFIKCKFSQFSPFNISKWNWWQAMRNALPHSQFHLLSLTTDQKMYWLIQKKKIELKCTRTLLPLIYQAILIYRNGIFNDIELEFLGSTSAVARRLYLIFIFKSTV